MNIINETKEKIRIIETELEQIAAQLDQERKESNQEDNLSIHNELMDKKQYLESQLSKLQESLGKLTITKVKNNHQKELNLGMEVLVDINGSKKNITIVSPIQANPTRGLVSSESPIGQALLGKEIGSKVDITTPAGVKTYAILDIKQM
jgi:transcription elongation factor GreA